MIHDIRKLPSGTTLDADLCIIGGGAASISMASALAGSPLSVVILESGGLRLDKASQKLTQGSNTGIPYWELDNTRYRMLGGATYRWGARSAPLRPIDLDERPWVERSGWPIERDELMPYYDRVDELVGLRAPFRYDGDVYGDFDITPPAFDPEKLANSAFQFGKLLLFGEVHREMLRSARNVDVYLYANVTNIQSNEQQSHVDHVDVRTLAGQSYRVRAKRFVLACGGIENPRLLLLSDGVNPKGLCNDSDLVGRCFMEHPTVNAGTVVAPRWQNLHDVFSPGLVGGRLVEVGLALTPALQAQHETLNAIARTVIVADQDATQALRELLWNLKHRRMPVQLNWYQSNQWVTGRMWTVMKDPFSVVENVVRHLLGKPKRFKIDSLYLEVRSEQAPNPDSRVTLSDATDELGQRRASLAWRMGEIEKRTMRVAAETVDRELRRLEIGELQMAEWLSADGLDWPDDMVGGHHHMGTTRMSDSPMTGVVDASCKAHGIDNLYVAGSSVFPTSSYVNPTYTLLALALRLSDHLKATA